MMTHSNCLSCHEFLELLTKHPHDLLSQERIAFDRHVQQCSSCERLLMDDIVIKNLLEELPSPEFSTDFPVKLRQMMQKGREKEKIDTRRKTDDDFLESLAKPQYTLELKVKEKRRNVGQKKAGLSRRHRQDTGNPLQDAKTFGRLLENRRQKIQANKRNVSMRLRTRR